ncbi:hypothetical protein [Azonexus hydrophilus]|uniref:capsular polysaccharide export protein, LipB/KpsS family n=1 Tax=Azonexus hydrophilus TaxID=418702 RepID=UPI0003FBABCC|nr:hypothetical protein [Azonexus hydrophilus]
MKILFIENRYATLIWDAVARQLEARGHEIYWIIQNPMFMPTVGEKHLLSFPSASEKNQDESLSWLRDVDRGVRWFGGDGSHWHPYNKRIRKILESVRPDVVFGEPTQFHEQLTLENARQMGIRFLSPIGTRYPAGRLHFFDYDTINPVGGEGVNLNDSELENMLDAIVERKVVPSYMKVVSQPLLKKKWGKLKNKLLITTGWLMGERYVTPSPLTKMRLERAHAIRCLDWEGFSQLQLPESLKNRPWVLYPLQMQPEVNIELWGKPWSYQTQIIKRAAQSLEKLGAVLVVKPNPKSKYELSDDLCDLVKNTPNIIALSHKTPMKAVFPQAPLLMTVTGTVTLECIFAGKPIAVLGNHAMTQYAGLEVMSQPEDIASVMEKVLTQRVKVATRDDAKSILNYLYTKSYPVTLWHQLDRPELMTERNVNALTDAFEDVLNHLCMSYEPMCRQGMRS